MWEVCRFREDGEERPETLRSRDRPHHDRTAARSKSAWSRRSFPRGWSKSLRTPRVGAEVLIGEQRVAVKVELTQKERRRTEALTRARVARLAAEGLTAREISERLFISARTVEGHLMRAYTKLGVRDRQGLQRLFNATAKSGRA